MFYVYILKSRVDNELYIGSTNDLRKRVKDHNDSKVKSTKHRVPFDVVYYEAYKCEQDARKREKQLKRRGAVRKGLIQRVAGSISLLS